jgi:D-alanyl-D-alanine carboxypeptidase (penicillin-binding protein 5/6)
MSYGRPVLEGGQASRRGRRMRGGWRRRRVGGWRQRRAVGHRLLLILSGAAFTLVALLVFMAAEATGPSKVALPRASAPSPRRSQPVRSKYGLALAPQKQRVNVRLRLGLRSGLLFDVRTGAVLWSLHPERVLAIASLTKMMTALIVVAHSRATDRVLITPDAVHFTGSGIGLLPVHKRVPELPLLYGLLLPSGNDAAIALAQHVAGTRTRFIAMMNARAYQLGLSCTHFNSVSGIVDYDNYSCAPDLALIAHGVLTQPLLARIVGSRRAILPFPIKARKLYLYNNNPLFYAGYSGIDGVKTGYTNLSGPCLVAAARRGKAWLGVVLLHSADIIDQAERLLNAGFANARGA